MNPWEPIGGPRYVQCRENPGHPEFYIHGSAAPPECPHCAAEKFAEQVFGSANRPSDEELFNREWAL